MPWFPPFTQNSGHSVGGEQQNSRIFKGMAAWRRASWRLTHVVPRDKNWFVTKAFLCVIPSAGLMTTPKCTLNIKRELIFSPGANEKYCGFLENLIKGAEHWNFYPYEIGCIFPSPQKKHQKIHGSEKTWTDIPKKAKWPLDLWLEAKTLGILKGFQFSAPQNRPDHLFKLHPSSASANTWAAWTALEKACDKLIWGREITIRDLSSPLENPWLTRFWLEGNILGGDVFDSLRGNHSILLIKDTQIYILRQAFRQSSIFCFTSIDSTPGLQLQLVVPLFLLVSTVLIGRGWKSNKSGRGFNSGLRDQLQGFPSYPSLKVG